MKKKLLALVLCAAMAATALTGCGGEDADKPSTQSGAAATEVGNYAVEETLKIGVLVSDGSTAESLSFRAYYEDYLAKQYEAEFIYSEELADAEGEISAIEQFITQGCKGVISLSSFDRPGQMEACEDAGLYYGVAAGTLADADYETYKDYEYYVGSVGPSLETEFKAGYDMAKHFIEKGDKNFLIFTGAAAYGTEMHVYRIAGMFVAMNEADSTTTYGGASTKEDIIAAIYADLGVKKESFSSETFVVDAVNGYTMDDAWFGEIAEKLGTPGLETVLAVGNGSDFFGSMTASMNLSVEVGSVDAYAQDYATAMENGQLHYMAGKFAPGIAPIFVALVNAVNGAPLRTADGCAFTIDQGYWVATSSDDFNKYLEAGTSLTDPVYNKTILDNYISTSEKVVTYDEFAGFVGAYTFDEIQALK